MSKLKGIRIASGITQKELSERSGINARIIQYYEQGYRDINKAQAITLYKLAQELKCTVEDLLEIKKEVEE